MTHATEGGPVGCRSEPGARQVTGVALVIGGLVIRRLAFGNDVVMTVRTNADNGSMIHANDGGPTDRSMTVVAAVPGNDVIGRFTGGNNPVVTVLAIGADIGVIEHRV